MKKGPNHQVGGFTLIELLIVVSIIGILSALVTVNLQDARERARDAQRKSDVRAIRNALELYKNDQKPMHYPETDDYAIVMVSGNYLKSIPVDPVARQNPDRWSDYSYESDGDLTYTVVACLENEVDVDKDSVDVCESGVSFTQTEP